MRLFIEVKLGFEPMQPAVCAVSVPYRWLTVTDLNPIRGKRDHLLFKHTLEAIGRFKISTTNYNLKSVFYT